MRRVLGYWLGLCLVASPALSQSADEIRFAKSWMNSLQQQSFDNNSEYCGYLGRSANGKFAVTRPRKGKSDNCSVRWSNKMDTTASYHTHGSFDPHHYNEIPSTDDILGDHLDGVNGYVATPGGRLWFIDGKRKTARQICGIGCLLQDPKFIEGYDGVIPKVLRYSDVERIENE
ncbi:MAG: DUF4329 domain-containing protein [Pseudoruegeria sp.]